MSPAAAHCSFCCSWIAIEIASSRLTARSVVGDCSILCINDALARDLNRVYSNR